MESPVYPVPQFPGTLEGQAPVPEDPFSLWYRKPAKEWTQALPIGNGRLGAMVFGGIQEEHLQINESTLWSGGPYDPTHGDALPALKEARALIFSGRYQEAHQWIEKHMMARPLWQAAYQPMGSLILSFPAMEKVADYRRELTLDEAVVRTEFIHQGVRYRREVFASPVHQVIVLRLTADKPGSISFSARFASPQDAKSATIGNDRLLLVGKNGSAPSGPGQLNFQARLRVIPKGGKILQGDTSLKVEHADSVILILAAATSYNNFKDVAGDPAQRTQTTLDHAARIPFGTLLAKHLAEHRRLFRRVNLDLGRPIALPTDERLARFQGQSDPHLAALYFQFGRYLLISSSRPGGQPANLQGIWNDSMTPPWGSKYTLNINTQMNYWPAETTNLAECHEPLFQMVNELAETGKRTAKAHYGAHGWVVHHNTDAWRASAPIDGPTWGMWPLGGAWLALHLWEHYRFSEDTSFLAKHYPVLKGAARFFLDTLVPDPKRGYLVTVPSLSPENPHPFGASVCAGPSMDAQILRDLFQSCRQAANILHKDAALQARLKEAQDRLPPHRIGSAGQLQEWLEDWDLKAPDLHHRHVSHLYALFPSNQITLHGTPELAQAARKSLEIRGDMATGWGLAWRLNLWARLQDAQHSYEILRLLLSPGRTYPNLLDAHPPFQIDGNFGGTAGIAEMLMQSHAGEIELLPALPKDWPTGAVSGLKARGNTEVAMQWEAGKLVFVEVKKQKGGTVRLRYGGLRRELSLKPGEARALHFP